MPLNEDSEASRLRVNLLNLYQRVEALESSHKGLTLCVVKLTARIDDFAEQLWQIGLRLMVPR